MATIGDLGGDHITDIAVGAASFPVHVKGTVFIVFLNANGTVRSMKSSGGDPAADSPLPLLSAEEFGGALAWVGGALMVGAGQNGNAPGKFYRLVLNSNGTVNTYSVIENGAPGIPPGTIQPGDSFGYSAASIGDLDGNGVEDFVAGMKDSPYDGRGSFMTLFMQANGTVGSFQRVRDMVDGDGNGGDGCFPCGELGNRDGFASALAPIEDRDGDGVSDLAVGTPGSFWGGRKGAFYELSLDDGPSQIPVVCELRCGDKVIVAPETCDDGNTSDGDGCSSTCTVEPFYTCSGWCPQGRSLCSPVPCGNGVIGGSEQCDDGNHLDGDGCSSACAIESGWTCNGQPSVCTAVCGDGLIRGPEQCDDHNTQNGDCCSATCAYEPAGSPCSDGSACTLSDTCNGAGGCVGGPPLTCDTCQSCDSQLGCVGATCTPVPTGTPTTTPTMTPTLTPTNSPPGTPTSTPTLATPTITPRCGNGVVDPGEQCDDGNAAPGDGCDNTCRREAAFCCGNPNRTCNSDLACPVGDTCCLTHCDSGSNPNPPSCDGLGPACSSSAQCGPGGMCCHPVCGNGFIELGEDCDEGPDNGGAVCTCSSTCKNAGLCTNDPSVCCVTDGDCVAPGTCCGNGIVTLPETCDDGNRVDDDACRNSCTSGPGPAACPGFVGAQVVQATVRRTTFTDGDLNQLIEQWKTRGSMILSSSQANRFDPERQPVQVRYAERATDGSRKELWPASPVIGPSDCPPNQFCFPRMGRPTRFVWKKVRDPDELFTPGVRVGQFKQRANELSFLFNGKLATITAPTVELSPAESVFLVRQDVTVGGLCSTVQLQCARSRSQKRYTCVPSLLTVP